MSDLKDEMFKKHFCPVCGSDNIRVTYFAPREIIRDKMNPQNYAVFRPQEYVEYDCLNCSHQWVKKEVL